MPRTAEQKGEGGCKISGHAPAAVSGSEPDIIKPDVKVPRILTPAAVGIVMEQLAQVITHLSISYAGGDCPHSSSPSPSRGLNVVGQDREVEKHEEEKHEGEKQKL